MRQSDLMAVILEQSKMIMEFARMPHQEAPIVARLQATIDAQQQTIDRVIAHQFDRPIQRTVQPQPDNAPPQMMLWDQDSSDGPTELQTGLQNLHVESDAAFLESVQ